MTRRPTNAGVTLVEMLVVLVAIGILSAAVALTLPRTTSGTTPELAAIRLSADLDRAVQHALDHRTGFGVKANAEEYSFWVADQEQWRPHPDPILRDVKPFATNLRISVQDHENVVFAVSRHLVPAGSSPWQVTLGQGASAHRVIFDGLAARIVPAGGD